MGYKRKNYGNEKERVLRKRENNNMWNIKGSIAAIEENIFLFVGNTVESNLQNILKVYTFIFK